MIKTFLVIYAMSSTSASVDIKEFSSLSDCVEEFESMEYIESYPRIGYCVDEITAKNTINIHHEKLINDAKLVNILYNKMVK